MDSALGSPNKALYLWSDAPRFEISTAPLTDKDGQAVQLPDSFNGDHALFLSDQQVLLFTPSKLGTKHQHVLCVCKVHQDNSDTLRGGKCTVGHLGKDTGSIRYLPNW